jgi:general L-amino acid transport system permease protein
MAQAETLLPPRTNIGVVGWLKRNLFSSWYNALLTIIALVVIIAAVRSLVEWALSGARWESF